MLGDVGQLLLDGEHEDEEADDGEEADSLEELGDGAVVVVEAEYLAVVDVRLVPPVDVEGVEPEVEEEEDEASEHGEYEVVPEMIRARSY